MDRRERGRRIAEKGISYIEWGTDREGRREGRADPRNEIDSKKRRER
jgi:hypothetical protein